MSSGRSLQLLEPPDCWGELGHKRREIRENTMGYFYPLRSIRSPFAQSLKRSSRASPEAFSAHQCLLLGFWMLRIHVRSYWGEEMWAHHQWDSMILWILMFFLHLPAASYFSLSSNHPLHILFRFYSRGQCERKGEAHFLHVTRSRSPTYL